MKEVLNVNITIFGTGTAQITISSKGKHKDFNQDRDVALLSEAIMLNVDSEMLAKILLYMSRKITNKSIDSRMNEIVKEGKPAVLIQYPNGDKVVNSQDELIEMVRMELDEMEESEAYDEDLSDDLEDEDDYYDESEDEHDG